MNRWNPIRDAAAWVELGERARDALSSSEDWGEVITIWAHQQGLPPALIANATGHRDALAHVAPVLRDAQGGAG